MSVETLFLIALVFLALELIVTSMGALAFIGFIVMTYGLVTMYQTGMTDLYGVGIQSIAVIGLTLLILYVVGGYFAYKSFGKKVETGVESMIGTQVTVTKWQGNAGQVNFEGEDWRAESNDPISKGDTVTIADYKNLTLTVNKKD